MAKTMFGRWFNRKFLKPNYETVWTSPKEITVEKIEFRNGQVVKYPFTGYIIVRLDKARSQYCCHVDNGISSLSYEAALVEKTFPDFKEIAKQHDLDL